MFHGKEVIGSFAISLSKPGAPTDAQIELLKTAGNLAGIAIGRERSDAEIKTTEEALRHAQKLESLGVLAGGIAHDFNNLLTGILGNAELSLDHASDDDGPLRARLSRIIHAANRAADLTKQMLAYSGRAEFSNDVMFLPDLVEEVAALLASSISKKAQLSFDVAADLPNIEGDSTQMRQLVMNILSNASEALGDRPGEIVVTMRQVVRSEVPASVRFSGDGPEAERYVVLTVRDSGHGMDEKTVSRIFDPFYSTKFLGRGLGLAVVHGIVRGQKGALDVRSEVGVGTSFNVYMPVCEKPMARIVDSDPVDWTGEATVLLVDDEEVVVGFATDVLETANLRTINAKDGQEAVDIYRGRCDEIDVVVLDLTMPKLGGREVFEKLRAIREDVRIVLSSGYVEGDATHDFGDQDLAGFVQKPYTPSALLRVIRDSLS